jgi:hypothetical protein
MAASVLVVVGVGVSVEEEAVAAAVEVIDGLARLSMKMTVHAM